MTQNIYDRPEFFTGYGKLKRSEEGLDGAAEWPAIRAVLPDVKGSSIVDLGCGYGWFARWARQAGAAHVLAVDVSARMIAHAQTFSEDAGIDYRIADLETLELPAEAFDLAYSSLALHYIERFKRLVRVVHAGLRANGDFVFSIEHPIYMASRKPGWILDAHGRRSWPVDSYAVEGRRITDWLAKGVEKQHRRMSTTLNTLIAAGFVIRHVDEWGPSAEDLDAEPTLAEEVDRPMMLIVAARKGG